MFKSIVLIICFVLSTMSVFAQKKKKVYYSLGATEEQVLRIQGQPTSMSTTGSYSTYHYGYSYLSFTDGYLTSYDNSNRNLRIKITPQNQVRNKNLNKRVMYVYFIYKGTAQEMGGVFGDMKIHGDDISNIYAIWDYSDEKLSDKKSCLTQEYKSSRGGGGNVYLKAVTAESKSLINALYETEEGSVNSTGFFCRDY